MKPTIKNFQKVAEKCGGNITKIAKTFGVYRSTIYDWAIRDNAYKKVIDEFRGRIVEDCIESAKLSALGVPEYDENGNFKGWKERPDGQTLRYLLSTLGRNEGFGESLDITTNGESFKPDPITIEIIDSRTQIENNSEIE